MLTINRLRMPIPEARELEDAKAAVVKERADIDYVAMMTDVDIPTEDGGQKNDI